MGKLFEREYYKISAAAAEIGCEVDDLIHWAATGRISLGVLYEIHGFELEQYRYIDNASSASDRVEEFTGFVYVVSGYFQDMEREGGNLNFYSVRFMNGRELSNMAIVENDKCETRSLDQIYIHSDDLRKFLASSIPATGNKATYSTPILAILNATVKKFFEPRRDRDAKKEEVVEWIKEQMKAAKMADSDNVAAAIFTIIKPVDHDPRRRRG